MNKLGWVTVVAAGAAIVVGGILVIKQAKNLRSSELPQGAMLYGPSKTPTGHFETFSDRNVTKEELPGACEHIAGGQITTGALGEQICSTGIGPATTMVSGYVPLPLSADGKGPKQCSATAKTIPLGYMRAIDCRMMGGMGWEPNGGDSYVPCRVYSCLAANADLSTSNYVSSNKYGCVDGDLKLGVVLPNMTAEDCMAVDGTPQMFPIPGTSGYTPSCLLTACARKTSP